MRGFPSCLFILLGLVAIARSATHFTHPLDSQGDDNFANILRAQLGDTLNIVWQTDLPKTNLSILQKYPPPPGGNSHQRLQTNGTSKSYNWTVSLEDDAFHDVNRIVNLGGFGIFFLTLYQEGTLNRAGQSQFINITRREADSTSSSAPTPTQTSAAITAVSTAPATSTPTPTVVTSGSAASASAATIGGAVGGTIAGIAVLALLVWTAGWLHKRRRAKQTELNSQREASSRNGSEMGDDHQGESGAFSGVVGTEKDDRTMSPAPSYPYHELYEESRPMPSELSAVTFVHEAP